MLTVERRFMIKHWYEKGMSISDIARLTGHDRKTIRKVLEEPVIPNPRPRGPRFHPSGSGDSGVGRRCCPGSR